MRLQVVGCSGSVPRATSAASCYLVQASFEGRTFSLLLDLGSGAFGALQSHLDPSDVDAIGLSHLHPDHCLDVCPYYVAASHSASAPWRRIPLYGPNGTRERLRRAYEVSLPGGADEPGEGIAGHFDYRTWAAQQQLGPFRVRSARVDHAVEGHAVRLEGQEGTSVVYSGDTGPTEALTRLATGADLLLCEASFADRPDNPPSMHLSGRQAGEVAAAAGVGRLVLTHIPPWRDPQRALADAQAAFEGPVELASPGAVWEV